MNFSSRDSVHPLSQYFKNFANKFLWLVKVSVPEKETLHRVRKMPKKYGAAIPPPSSIDDEHLRKVHVEKSVIVEPTEKPVLSEYELKMQALREKLVCGFHF